VNVPDPAEYFSDLARRVLTESGDMSGPTATDALPFLTRDADALALQAPGPLDLPLDRTGPGGSLSAVLDSRKSLRNTSPPSTSAVIQLLARVGLNGQSTLDGSVARRAYPSPGNTHPHSLVLLSHSLERLGRTSWVVDPDLQTLRPLKVSKDVADKALRDQQLLLRLDQLPAAAIFTVARPARLLDRYPSGLTMLFREAGALLQTLHLVAVDVGIGSSMTATTGSLFPPNWQRSGFLDTGALVLGDMP
jgi:SagB-type dehydrogenase family enzyme